MIGIMEGALRDAQRIIILEKELAKYKAAYEVLIGANEFYTDKENWSKFKDETDLYSMIDPIDYERFSDLTTQPTYFGGKNAREAAKKIVEILK